MSIEMVILSNHLILCHPLLLLPSIFPSIRVFSNEPAQSQSLPWLQFLSLPEGLQIQNSSLAFPQTPNPGIKLPTKFLCSNVCRTLKPYISKNYFILPPKYLFILCCIFFRMAFLSTMWPQPETQDYPSLFFSIQLIFKYNHFYHQIFTTLLEISTSSSA